MRGEGWAEDMGFQELQNRDHRHVVGLCDYAGFGMESSTGREGGFDQAHAMLDMLSPPLSLGPESDLWRCKMQMVMHPLHTRS